MRLSLMSASEYILIICSVLPSFFKPSNKNNGLVGTVPGKQIKLSCNAGFAPAKPKESGFDHLLQYLFIIHGNYHYPQ
jgi:hypothetical protein